ncbi:MAG TPA: DUF4349 domain-containing protein [Steroidobacteraceae bacterium]|nr:DUF4349 domain-containing protein [Steroidobacteraceae bacterium]
MNTTLFNRSSVHRYSATCICLIIALSISACGQRAHRLAGQPGAAVLPSDIKTKIVMEQRKPDSTLAYTHDVSVEVAKDRLQSQLDAVRDACVSDKQAQCTILNVDSELASSLPSGSISMRLIPQKVATIVNVAATNGHVTSTHTSAEDLAPELDDTAQKLTSLNNYRDRLNSIMSKRDLNPDQLISVARELSNTQSEIDELMRSRSKLRQRIDTDLLTIRFTVPGEDYTATLTPVKDALSSFSYNFRSAVAAVISFTAYLLPWIPIIFLAFLGIRKSWRLLKKKSAAPSTT